MKGCVKVKSSVHLNTLQPLLQRMRGILKANNKLGGGGGGVTQKNPTPTLEKVRLG